MPVLDHLRAPIRCYNCQRYGHGALACRRKVVCAFCSLNHSSKDCNSSEKKCKGCGQAHSSSFVRCPIFKLASNIAHKEQTGTITREEASKQYADLYTSTSINRAQIIPSLLPSQSDNVTPSAQTSSPQSLNGQ